jgi:hypothetical protein
VGRDHQTPAISLEDAQWAFAVVQHGIETLSAKFETGEIGGTENDEARQENELVRGISKYLTTEYNALPNKGRVARSMHEDRIIPLSYLQSGVGRCAAFKKARPNPTDALRRTIQGFLDAGDLVEVGRSDLVKHNKSGRAFMVSNVSRFFDLDEPEALSHRPRTFFNQ